MALLKNNDNYLVWLYINIVSVFFITTIEFYGLPTFSSFIGLYSLDGIKREEKLTIVLLLHFPTPLNYPNSVRKAILVLHSM